MSARIVAPMSTVNEIVEDYVALWSEPDESRRRALLQERWAPDAVQLLEPPEDVRATAARIGFLTPALVAHSHTQFEDRVAISHAEFIAPAEFAFRARPGAVRLDDVVKVGWEMVSVATGEVAGGGLDLLVLDSEDRIRRDYQFITG
jgi:hypothetical protein